ncbi:hypothetical protein [Kitasatospora sp. NPDC094015]|uniref:hypothetical protein n=1 Tax=Kitasatospora sp. NPDC094015 TaxID=3155205 RepID=UPI00331BB311
MEALIAAIVGVSGTLCATWLTQRSGERALAAERLDGERRQHAEESSRVAERERDSRRASYVALNQAARRYFGALSDSLHQLPSSGAESQRSANAQTSELDEVRVQYRASYAGAQMIVPDPVLTVAAATNRELNQAFGILKRLHRGAPREQDSEQQIRTHLDAARGLLHELRREMRVDLGVTQSP